MKISEVADDNQKLFDNMHSRGAADRRTLVRLGEAMTTLYSQRHYIDLAKFLSEQRDAGFDLPTLDDLTRCLADHFERDNHKFKRALFLSVARCW